jgi:hypothetical protein
VVRPDLYVSGDPYRNLKAGFGAHAVMLQRCLDCMQNERNTKGTKKVFLWFEEVTSL